MACMYGDLNAGNLERCKTGSETRAGSRNRTNIHQGETNIFQIITKDTNTTRTPHIIRIKKKERTPHMIAGRTNNAAAIWVY